MLEKFLQEEKGQGAIEYIMLAGGIIVAAIIIFVIYKQAASSAGLKMNASIAQTGTAEKAAISNQLNQLNLS